MAEETAAEKKKRLAAEKKAVKEAEEGGEGKKGKGKAIKVSKEIGGLNEKGKITKKIVVERSIVEGDYILKGNVKISSPVTIKKGTKIDRKVQPVLVRKLMAEKSEALEQKGEIFTVTEPIKVDAGQRIVKGTPLTMPDDKVLIEYLKERNPAVLGIEKKIKEVTIETKDKGDDE